MTDINANIPEAVMNGVENLNFKVAVRYDEVFAAGLHSDIHVGYLVTVDPPVSVDSFGSPNLSSSVLTVATGPRCGQSTSLRHGCIEAGEC